MDEAILLLRSRMVSSVRDFFLAHGYLEVDTPALAPSLIPEACLEVFGTEYVHPTAEKMPLYLIPSPEFWMKKAIATSQKSVFQLCKSWRNAESVSPLHNPEFTMLEYYGVGLSSADNIGLTEELFQEIVDTLHFDQALSGFEVPDSVRPPFRIMTMKEACAEFAHVDLDALIDEEAMREACRSRGLLVPRDAAWEDAFNILFLSLVEPALPRDRPLVLDQYPKGIECLAADIPGTQYKARWELYIDGVEIANCFTEMTDPVMVRQFFTSQQAKKAHALVPHRVDPHYVSIFDNFPPCSGVALGFERLLMVMSGKNQLKMCCFFLLLRGEAINYCYEACIKS